MLRALGVTLHIPAPEVQAALDAVHARDLPLRAGREQLRGRLEQLALARFTARRPSADADDLARALRSGKELDGRGEPAVAGAERDRARPPGPREPARCSRPLPKAC